MLDFSQVATQLKLLSGQQFDQRERLSQALNEAGLRLAASCESWEKVQAKIQNSETSWLVAEWFASPEAILSAPKPPKQSIVFAADGSQIVSDRHDIALIYLLNVGFVTLRYGTDERATLTSESVIAPPDEELLNEDEGASSPISPGRLAQRRTLAELKGLAELIEKEAGKRSPNLPSLALTDGTLIMWQVENEEPTYRNRFLTEFQTCLKRARELHVPIAGYVSSPMSRDVVNSLRISVCPKPRAACDKFCPTRPGQKKHIELIEHPHCAGTERITDADLFRSVLKSGQRSVLFGCRSKVLSSEAYEEDNKILFFYLNSGREIARIEIPQWVAEDPVMLELTHSLCYDQAQKGDGYPVALAEAHEQAIVRGADRAALFQLVQRDMATERVPIRTTRKSLSKQARRV